MQLKLIEIVYMRATYLACIIMSNLKHKKNLTLFLSSIKVGTHLDIYFSGIQEMLKKMVKI